MKKTSGLHLFVGLIIFAVVVVAGVGMYIAGAPSNARALALDGRRVSDLQSISYAVDSFYNMEKRLPYSLDELREHRDIYLQSTVDPETGALYEYVVGERPTYQLCAQFALTSESSTPMQPYAVPAKPYGSSPDFWNHPAGYHCYAFEAKLNPAVYPPVR